MYITKKHFILKVTLIIFISAIAVSGMLSDYTNNYISKDLQKSKMRIESVVKLLNTEKFKNLPTDAKIYCPKLWANNSFMDLSITEQGNFNWFYYIDALTKKNYYTYRNKESIDTNFTTYYINYLQATKTDDNLISLSRIKDYNFIYNNSEILSDTVNLYYFSPTKKFSIFVESKQNTKIVVNKMDTVYHEKWINIKTNKIFQEIELIGNDILVDKIMISNMVEPNKRIIEVKN